jgi:two-component system, NarL family, response regulator LiaR
MINGTADVIQLRWNPRSILHEYFLLAMKKHVLTFGIIGGLLITVLQWTQYRFLVMEHSMEVYGAVIAAVFAVVGIWLGGRLKRSPAKRTEMMVGAPGVVTVEAARESFELDEKKREELGITRRELEVLELMAQGMSNREIAEKLFVSENTVKTHSSRVFDKLGAKRRTQAVQMGKELGLLP